MKVVSIGDLVIDYYYKDRKILGINGGMTSHNIIANLSNMGISTSVESVCGDDIQGKIAVKSLEKVGVDVKNIVFLKNIKTRSFHVSYYEENNILNLKSKKRCPFCNNKNWYEDSLIDVNSIINHLDKDDILVFDNLNKKNQFIIDNTSNKKIIDLGQYFELEKLTNEEIINKITNKFEIINLNERVSKYLNKRFEFNDDLELYRFLKPNFMTITKGEKGAIFIYDDIKYEFKLNKVGKVVDSTGAGDGFISSIIRDWVKNDFKYDCNLFEKWYGNSNKLTTRIVSKMGARGHINSLFKVKKSKNECVCENFDYNERKKIKRCNININNLEKKLLM